MLYVGRIDVTKIVDTCYIYLPSLLHVLKDFF